MATYDVNYILRLRDLMTAKLKQADVNAKNLHTSVNKLKASVGGLGSGLAGVFAVGAGVTAGKEIIETTAAMESLQTAIKFASGNAAEFAKNQEFLRKTNKNLKLETFASAEGFKTLLGSLKGSSLTGQDARNVFDAVATAARTMGLTAEQQKGAFTALGQIISKGKVQAEELRGQLGERIPGAFAIAAKSMNMTTKQLDKALSDGKVSADDFIRNFAGTLKAEFEKGIPEATQTLSANMVDLQNKVTDLKLALGKELVGSTGDLIERFGNLLTTLTKNADKIVKFGKFLLKLAKIYLKIRATLFVVRLAQVAYNAALIAGNVAMKAANAAALLYRGGLGAVTVAAKAAKLAVRGIFAGAIGVAVFAGIDMLISKFLGAKNQIAGANEEFEKFKRLAEQGKAVRDVVKLVSEGKLTDVSTSEIADALSVLQERAAGLKRDTGKIKRFVGFGPQGQIFREETDVEQMVRSKQMLEDLKGSFSRDINLLQSALDKMGGPSPVTAGPAGTTTAGVTEIKAAAPKVFNLNIDKLVETLTVQSQTLEEGAERVKEIIEEVLLTALADSQKSVR